GGDGEVRTSVACQGAKLLKAEIGVKYAIAMEHVFGRGDHAVEELGTVAPGEGLVMAKNFLPARIRHAGGWAAPREW
ncbi:MAG: hypothetical protein HW385_919, partial [candidate division NC10 bacterium]|nr:hypothetical protein [candidate division NC10 bacterium]